MNECIHTYEYLAAPSPYPINGWTVTVALRMNQVNGLQFTPAPSTYYYVLLTHFINYSSKQALISSHSICIKNRRLGSRRRKMVETSVTNKCKC